MCLSVGISLQTRRANKVLGHLRDPVAGIRTILNIVKEQVVVLAIMARQNLPKVKIYCNLSGRAVDASFRVLCLRIGHGDDQLVDIVITEDPNMLVLQQFPVTGTQE